MGITKLLVIPKAGRLREIRCLLSAPVFGLAAEWRALDMMEIAHVSRSSLARYRRNVMMRAGVEKL
jgi:hypothetical protein